MMNEPISNPFPPSIVEECGRMVSAVCRKMLRDPETAADAAQEVWLEVLKNYPGFDGRSKLSTWIYVIARRVVIRYAKDERIYTTRFLHSYFHGEDTEPPAETDVDHKVWVKSMCDQCLTGVLHCLDNDARIAYLFRDVAQLSYPEIATVLAVDEPTARQIVSRSRRKLRNFLNGECLLFNPKGGCRCRMRRMVESVDLPAEYQRISDSVARIDFFRRSEQVMPGLNYWEKNL